VKVEGERPKEPEKRKRNRAQKWRKKSVGVNWAGKKKMEWVTEEKEEIAWRVVMCGRGEEWRGQYKVCITQWLKSGIVHYLSLLIA